MAEPAPRPHPGSVQWYQQGLMEHIRTCETCKPPFVENYCEAGKGILHGLSYAKGREAHQTGALL